MKKSSLFIIAACALSVASCTKEETQQVDSSTAQNQIGFLSNTTRADILTLSDLQDDDNGFVVYGIKNGVGTWDEEMDGSNYYSYVNDYWGWTESSPMWPTDSDDYPIDFYAFYFTLDEDQVAADKGIKITNDNQSALAITYAAPTAGQTDILAASATAEARPSGDRLPLTFNHILSKVNFDITTGEEVTVYTQAVGLNSICNERSYMLSSSSWANQSASAIDDYPYLTTQNPAVDSSEDKISKVATNLMLLPQTTTSWDPSAGESTVSGSHIYLIYRAEEGENLNAIGYSDASLHPDYNEETDYAYYKEPLFVMVGYPLGETDFVLKQGQSYNYNISLGTDGATNGYLIDEYYYDKKGNRTKFLVENKDVNDPISDGYINFTVAVNSWIESDVDMD
ncbi:MAG: fimbrillin family protein [Rikenellaceae bacterium]